VKETIKGGGAPGTEAGVDPVPPVAAKGNIETEVGPAVVNVAVAFSGITL
jgi:hypothetical protein